MVKARDMHKKGSKISIRRKMGRLVGDIKGEPMPKRCVFIPTQELMRLIIVTCSKFGTLSHREILERFGFM